MLPPNLIADLPKISAAVGLPIFKSRVYNGVDYRDEDSPAILHGRFKPKAHFVIKAWRRDDEYQALLYVSAHPGQVMSQLTPLDSERLRWASSTVQTPDGPKPAREVAPEPTSAADPKIPAPPPPPPPEPPEVPAAGELSAAEKAELEGELPPEVLQDLRDQGVL